MKLFYIFPLKGPVNGVKVIANYVLDTFIEMNIRAKVIDTSQAKSYSNFGKFDFSKILFFSKILKGVRDVKKGDFIYMNFSTRGFSLYRDWFILNLLVIRKSNVTIHVHANGLESIPQFLKKVICKTKIIVINKDQFEKLKEYPSVFCIENALPDYYSKKFNPTIIESKNISLLYMSNISKPKGVDLLNNICQLIENKRLNYSLTISGGILDEYSKQIIDEIVLNHRFVNFLGPTEDSDQKMKLYREHDFLLFLSDENYEVYPLVYIESLMNGLPIITTKQIVAEQVTSDNLGLLLHQDNFISFISEFSDKKNRLELKRKIRQKFEKEYSFEEYCNSIKNIIFNE